MNDDARRRHSRRQQVPASAPARAAEAAARASYGRLVALLSRRTRDIPAAEDALSEAFATALDSWPKRGVPDNPEAWLLTVARRQLSRAERARQVRERATATVELLYEQAADAATDAGDGFPDERLRLLFVCAHPAIDEAVRTPLMLQTVLGLDAARIASAFLVAPATMGQRLVRAKAKIRDAGIAFEIPDEQALPARLETVLAAIYAAYGTGWDAVPGAEDGIAGLAQEAIWLGRVAVALMSDAPEAKGLLALMLFCEARRDARRDVRGRFIPLSRQDPARWSRPLIDEAEALLRDAARAGEFGRFQCEAAIQSVHCDPGISEPVRWRALRQLYDLLASRIPSVGVRVARAAVLLRTAGADAALGALQEIEADRVDGYQPYWVTLAAVLRDAGRSDEAAAVRQRAIALTRDRSVREFLIEDGSRT